ncbi:MAG: hypothetical protein HQM14_13815 [SAR324 cluster bacterium]|nr:hypothetical protein [SAR324 cluster bacterium]
MIPIEEQVKAIKISIKGIEHELKNESIFPPVRRELVRRKQCLESTVETLMTLEPLLAAYETLDYRETP